MVSLQLSSPSLFLFYFNYYYYYYYSGSCCMHPPSRWEGELVGDDLALLELHLMQGGGRENEAKLRRSRRHSECATSLVSMTRTENESQPC